MEEKKRNVVLKVDQDLHMKLKLHVVKQNTTLQEYIVGLILKDLDKSEMDENTKVG